MTDRKFYKRTFKVEFLSEEPIPDGMPLENIINEAINGDYSMNITRDCVDTLDGKQAARALLNHGSDPGFFQLTDKGEDADV